MVVTSFDLGKRWFRGMANLKRDCFARFEGAHFWAWRGGSWPLYSIVQYSIVSYIYIYLMSWTVGFYWSLLLEVQFEGVRNRFSLGLILLGGRGIQVTHLFCGLLVFRDPGLFLCSAQGRGQIVHPTDIDESCLCEWFYTYFKRNLWFVKVTRTCLAPRVAAVAGCQEHGHLSL